MCVQLSEKKRNNCSIQLILSQIPRSHRFVKMNDPFLSCSWKFHFAVLCHDQNICFTVTVTFSLWSSKSTLFILESNEVGVKFMQISSSFWVIMFIRMWTLSLCFTLRNLNPHHSIRGHRRKDSRPANILHCSAGHGIKHTRPDVKLNIKRNEMKLVYFSCFFFNPSTCQSNVLILQEQQEIYSATVPHSTGTRFPELCCSHHSVQTAAPLKL